MYRGASEFLQGTFWFADLCSARVWALFRGVGAAEATEQVTPEGGFQTLVAVGSDGFGELYLVSFSDGRIYRVTNE